MLATIPTREKRKPKSWTVPILIGFIIVLSIALSGLASLYYSATQSSDPIIVVNQTSNTSVNNTQHNISNTKIKANNQKTSDKNQEEVNKESNLDKLRKTG